MKLQPSLSYERAIWQALKHLFVSLSVFERLLLTIPTLGAVALAIALIAARVDFARELVLTGLFCLSIACLACFAIRLIGLRADE